VRFETLTVAIGILLGLLIPGIAYSAPPEPSKAISGPHPPGTTLTVPVESWVLPTPFYDECLAITYDVDDLQTRLDRCTELGSHSAEQAMQALDLSSKALKAANAQMDDDGNRVEELTLKLLDAQRVVDEKNAKIGQLKSQRNTAVAVTTGVVITLGTIAAVSLSP